MGTKDGKQIARWGDEGVTVTFVHRETGARSTVHEPGEGRLEALRRACDRFGPATWRADVVSTPQSIYDDLTHARQLTKLSDKYRGTENRGAKVTIQFSTGGVITGDMRLLGRAGRQAWT